MFCKLVNTYLMSYIYSDSCLLEQLEFSSFRSFLRTPTLLFSWRLRPLNLNFNPLGELILSQFTNKENNPHKFWLPDLTQMLDRKVKSSSPNLQLIQFFFNAMHCLWPLFSHIPLGCAESAWLEWIQVEGEVKSI